MCYGSNVSVKGMNSLIRVEGRSVLSCCMAEGTPQGHRGAVNTAQGKVALFFTHLGSLVYFFLSVGVLEFFYSINPNE